MEHNSDAAAGLGALLRSEGRTKEAGDHYRWALENCKWNPILISNACNWLREQNYVKESLSLLSTGLQRWPNDLRLRWGMVLSLHHGRKPEEALRKLEELIDEEGQRPLLMRKKIACLLSCERWDEALSVVKMRCSKVDDVGLFVQQIKLLQRLKRSQRAWELLRPADNFWTTSRC